MRLIDADALLKEVENEQKYLIARGQLSEEYLLVHSLKRPVLDAPTVDAVERKKGKWDFIGFQMFRCTACKHVFSQDSLEGWRTYTYEPTFPKFCPNCGADMRGENNE